MYIYTIAILDFSSVSVWIATEGERVLPYYITTNRRGARQILLVTTNARAYKWKEGAFFS